MAYIEINHDDHYIAMDLEFIVGGLVKLLSFCGPVICTDKSLNKTSKM